MHFSCVFLSSIVSKKKMQRIEALVVCILVIVAAHLAITIVIHRNILKLHSVHVIDPVPSHEIRQLSFIKQLNND